MEETIWLIERGRIEMPETADSADFILSDSKLAQPVQASRNLRLSELIGLYQAEQFTATKQEPKADIERIESADRFFQNTKAAIREGGNRVRYVQGDDLIRVPRIETFDNAESHVATLAPSWFTGRNTRRDRIAILAGRNGETLATSWRNLLPK